MIDEIKILKNVLINSNQNEYLFVIEEFLRSGKTLFLFKLDFKVRQALKEWGIEENENFSYKEQKEMHSLEDEFIDYVNIINKLCKKNEIRKVFFEEICNRDSIDSILINFINDIYIKIN